MHLCFDFLIGDCEERLHKYLVLWNDSCSRDRIVPDFDSRRDSAERCVCQFLLNILGKDGITLASPGIRYTDSEGVLMLVATLLMIFKQGTPSVTFLLDTPA